MSTYGPNFKDHFTLDEIGRKLAALGSATTMFVVATSIASGMGLAGGAVITTALALLGGSTGMVGGIALLVIAPLVVDAVAKYGLEAVLSAIYAERRRNGESVESLAREIDRLWISDELKRKLKENL